MESLCAYGGGADGSDDDAPPEQDALNSKESSKGFQADRGYPFYLSKKEDDTNYDHVTMDMSEESNNNNSDNESPRHSSHRTSSRSSRDKEFQRDSSSSEERRMSKSMDEKYDKIHQRHSPNKSTSKLYKDDNNKLRETTDFDHSSKAEHEISHYEEGVRKDYRNDEKEYDSRRNTDKKDRDYLDKEDKSHWDKKERERDRERDSDKSKEKYGSYSKERYDRRCHDDKRSHSDRRKERSRSRDRSSGSHKRRSSSGDRDKHGKNYGHRYSERSKRSNSRERRGFRRSHSKSPVCGSEYKPSYKVSKKLQAMDKMGLQIKTPDGSMATAQMLLQQTLAEQIEKVKNSTGIELPKYYNPAAMNPLKYANQIQKRKLLWSNKNAESSTSSSNVIDGPSVSQIKPGSNKWQDTKFAQDNDGKVASKFMRLMGIKNSNAAPVPPSPEVGGDIVKKREEMFEAMQAQYEVARATTHTMRGVGLGFSSHNKQF